jgi:hypothetical protein
MTFCGNPLSESLSRVKRTSLFAAHMSAFEREALHDGLPGYQSLAEDSLVFKKLGLLAGLDAGE